MQGFLRRSEKSQKETASDADDCIFPEDSQKTNSTYHELLRLLSLCDESSLKILTATATALISEKQNPSA